MFSEEKINYIKVKCAKKGAVRHGRCSIECYKFIRTLYVVSKIKTVMMFLLFYVVFKCTNKNY